MKTRKSTSEIEQGMRFRDLKIDTRKIDEETRTIEVAFSSEQPVLLWGEREILDHNPASVRLDRAKSHGPLLVDHNWTDHVGTIDDIRIDTDRVGRAVVRFGNSERANEIYQDVKDEIRKSISVGYRVYKWVYESDDAEGVPIYRVTDWEVVEISFVSVPADVAVGVGRDGKPQAKNTVKIIRHEAIPMEKTPEQLAAEQAEKQRQANEAEKRAKIEMQAMRDREADRQKAIREIAAMHPGHDNIVTDALRGEMTVAAFTEKLADAVLQARADDTPDTHLDLSDTDKKRYSICRALLAQASGNWKGAEAEREMSDTISKRLDADPKGIFVPYDIQTMQRNAGREGQRVVTTTGAGAGALGVDHLPGSFIDTLRDRSLLMSLGAFVLSGLRGNVSVPRKTGNATFGWVAEDADGTDSDVTIGTLTMSPKTLAGAVPISRLSLQQLSPDMDVLVMSDMAEGAALAVDIAGIAGATGGDNPVGILNTTGVLTNAIATAGQPTWAEVVNFETLAAAANALAGNSSYITTAAVRGFMKTAKKDAGSGIFLVEGNEANGYPVNVKTDAGFAANSILFGDYSQLIVGMWGVLDVMLDTATKAASGGLVIRMFQDLDFGVRQPTAFVKNTTP